MDAVRGEGVEEAAIAPPEVSLKAITEQLGSGQHGAAKRERGLPTLVKKPSSRVVRQCPFYKKIPGTQFSVDAFSYGDIPDCSAYFLSHFHSDHYVGLSQRFHHRLYCSQITGNLVSLHLRVPAQFVHTLPMDKPCRVDGVTVTLIEANHCPGSVMLLFELPDHTCHLHTGDFRASPAMEQHPARVGRVIHTLFLDTTYCNPRYEFPPQEQAVHFVVERCEAAICQDPETLLVIGAYSVGKEKVFLAMAEQTPAVLELCLNDSSTFLNVVAMIGGRRCWGKGFVFVPTVQECDHKLFHLRYDMARDTYERVSDGGSQVHSWEECVYEAAGVRSHTEVDWRMAYIARFEGCPNGFISWKFDFAPVGLKVRDLSIRVDSTVFRNGQVPWNLSSETASVKIEGGEALRALPVLRGASRLILQVELMGANWKDAQVFRQSLDAQPDKSPPFEIIVKLD